MYLFLLLEMVDPLAAVVDHLEVEGLLAAVVDLLGEVVDHLGEVVDHLGEVVDHLEEVVDHLEVEGLLAVVDLEILLLLLLWLQSRAVLDLQSGMLTQTSSPGIPGQRRHREHRLGDSLMFPCLTEP